ncbi:thioesterase family protein [Mesoflavibacter zeaxanthinifaciens]|jgi:acyl-CoA thioester hydrolase|uniref:acyl-CoA thioesterase n=1 Tax=Mesoflavibacter zeaxanthinifaciens TaxID=393060 RepID=UPI0026F0913E|nr:thioesterase family protein [Mesoflavibacter zeaxanthinifaciens]
MKIHQKQILVTKEDLDQNNHVNNIRYVKWVNDIAISHWETEVSTTILDQYFWVMLSHNIDYKHQILLGETVTLKTYVKSCEGLFSIRIVEILVDKKLCAYSETKWCFMNSKTLKPNRIPQEIIDLF